MRGAEAAMLIGLLACALLAARIVGCYSVKPPVPSEVASLFVEPGAE